MRTALKKTVSSLMLFIFLMGFGVSGFSAKLLAHELDHDSHTVGVLAEHDHALADGASADSKSEPLGDVEHRLLHAACHCQSLLVGSIPDGIGPSLGQEAPSISRGSAPLTAEPEPLFRPPRNIHRT